MSILTLRNDGKFRYGLGFKSIISVSILIIVISLVSGWWFRRMTFQSLTEEYHEYGLALATNSADDSSYGTAIGDMDILQASIQDVLSKPHVIYAAILDSGGQVLQHVSNEVDGNGVIPQEILQKALDSSEPMVHYSGREEVCNVSAPIEIDFFEETSILDIGPEILASTASDVSADAHRKIGTMLLGVSTRGIHEKIGRLQKKTIVFTLGLMIMGIAASVWFMGRIISPVKGVAQMASVLAAGDFSKFIPVKAKSSDETSELATAFNQMAADLQMSSQKLEESNQTLEQRVKDRTQELEDAYARLRQSEHEIRKNLETLDMVVTGLQGYLYLTDTESYDIKWANSYLTEQKGDAVNKKCHQLILGQENPCTDCARREVLSSGLSVQKTVEREFADGKRYFLHTWSPIRDEDNNITQLLHLILDITEQKQLEQQLILSEKHAALGVMAGSIGHELNNAVSPLVGYASMLQAQSDNREWVEKTAEVFMSQSERIALHARNLLSLSKPTEPKTELLFIEDILEETTNTLSISGILKRYTILREYAKDLPSIYGDKHLLEQVIRNLEINSAHAMGDQGILTVGSRMSADDACVEFYIKDIGCGIPEDEIDKIFEPFFTTKEDGKGTGLGMMIVKRIVEKHGGYIHVDSQVGRGTTMTIGIPVAREPSPVLSGDKS